MKQRREVETDEFLAMCSRLIRAAGRRVGESDTVDLAGLVRLRHELEEIEARAVMAQRERHGFSWSEIARDLGFNSRQAAAQYYERRIGA